MEKTTKRVTKNIVSETLELQLDADIYERCIDVLNEKSVVSPTFKKLLSENSKNGLPDITLPNILIENMIIKFGCHDQEKGNCLASR